MAYYERLIRDKPRRRDRDHANIYFVIARQFVNPWTKIVSTQIVTRYQQST